MDAFDVQPLYERQLLGGVLSQVINPLTRISIPGIPLPTFSLPLGLASSRFTSSSSTQPSSLPSSSHSATVTASSSSSLSSLSSTSSTLPLTSSVTPTPTPTPSHPPIPIETVQAQQQTVTTTALQTTSPSPTLASSPPTTFLQNKVLSGVVFTICGIVALVLIFAIGTLALRTRRRLRNRRLDEIVSFDPVNHNRLGFDDEPGRESIEKVSQSHSSSGHEYSHGPTTFTSGSRPGGPYFVPPITVTAPQQGGPGYSEFWSPPHPRDQRVPNVIPRIPPPAHLFDQPY